MPVFTTIGLGIAGAVASAGAAVAAAGGGLAAGGALSAIGGGLMGAGAAMGSAAALTGGIASIAGIGLVAAAGKGIGKMMDGGGSSQAGSIEQRTSVLSKKADVAQERGLMTSGGIEGAQLQSGSFKETRKVFGK